MNTSPSSPESLPPSWTQTLRDAGASEIARAEMRQQAGWIGVRERLFSGAPAHGQMPDSFLGWKRLITAAAVVFLVVWLAMPPVTFGEPDVQVASYQGTQEAGIYATAFYSKEAGADVVWISGLSVSTVATP